MDLIFPQSFSDNGIKYSQAVLRFLIVCDDNKCFTFFSFQDTMHLCIHLRCKNKTPAKNLWCNVTFEVTLDMTVRPGTWLSRGTLNLQGNLYGCITANIVYIYHILVLCIWILDIVRKAWWHHIMIFLKNKKCKRGYFL